MLRSHEFAYCRATEIPIPHFVPEHDDFADTLELNYEAIEPENVALFALHLIGKDKKPAIDTTGMEFVPECGRLNAFFSSVDNHTPIIPDNVLYLDDYRGGDNAA